MIPSVFVIGFHGIVFGWVITGLSDVQKFNHGYWTCL